MNKNIIAGIVTYNPELTRLYENVKAIAPQVQEVVIVDNNSKNILEIEEVIWSFSNVSIIKLSSNAGIAKALNVIGNYAVTQKYQWFLTLDQDSVCKNNLIQIYEKYLDLQNIGMLCCKIKDRNFEFKNKIEETMLDVAEITKCITSGSLVKTELIDSDISFDEKMFIDNVDFDYCLQLRKKNYKIYQVNFIGLLHEIGNSSVKKIFNKQIVIHNHNVFRRYYIARNNIYIVKKHGFFDNTIKYIPIEMISVTKVILFETEKINKLKATIKGYKDGLRMKVSER